MFFGLTNSPAMFCQTMARMFWHLVNKYPTELFVYMDNTLIATKQDTPCHREIINAVLTLLAKESYFLCPSNCIFKQWCIEYLGIIVDVDKLSIDPTKANGLQDWPRMLKTVKEVCSILGTLGYQQPFIPHYMDIAKPLTELTKKNHPFLWTPACHHALDMLISTVLANPSLCQPDPSKPYSLQVDASAYTTSAILTQPDSWGKDEAVGFHSQSFSEVEWNYDIHNQELLVLVRGLNHWCHLVIGTQHPISVYTDHKNLEYYHHPQHINCHMAHYIPCLADYNYILYHLPGTSNKADMLSRCSDFANGSTDNDEVTVLPPTIFACTTTLSTINDWVHTYQLSAHTTLSHWATTFPLTRTNDFYWHGDCLVVVDNSTLRRGVLSLYHDLPTAGHSGISKSIWLIGKDY